MNQWIVNSILKFVLLIYFYWDITRKIDENYKKKLYICSIYLKTFCYYCYLWERTDNKKTKIARTLFVIYIYQ